MQREPNKKFFAVLQELLLLSPHIAIVFTTIIHNFLMQQKNNAKLLAGLYFILLFLAGTLLLERYFVLKKIDKKIDKDRLSSLDQIFICRAKLLPLTERLEDANDITITGAMLGQLLENNLNFFTEKAKQGCKLTFVMVNPDSEALGCIFKSLVSASTTLDKFKGNTQSVLCDLQKLQAEHSNNVLLYLSDLVPPYSIIAKNLESKKADSRIQVELYSHLVDIAQRRIFTVDNKHDTNTYDFFCEQINTILKKSKQLLSS